MTNEGSRPICRCGCGRTKIGPKGFVQTHDSTARRWINDELQGMCKIDDFEQTLSDIAHKINTTNGDDLAEWAIEHMDGWFRPWWEAHHAKREWKNR